MLIKYKQVTKSDTFSLMSVQSICMLFLKAYLMLTWLLQLYFCRFFIKFQFRAWFHTPVPLATDTEEEVMFLKGRKLLPKLEFGKEIGISTLH